jgi:hypothetical protein
MERKRGPEKSNELEVQFSADHVQDVWNVLGDDPGMATLVFRDQIVPTAVSGTLIRNVLESDKFHFRFKRTNCKLAT